MKAFLTHPLLEEIGVVHGFGTRAASEPPGLLRPRQVHGTDVVIVTSRAGQNLGDADAIATTLPGVSIGVITADCVPILVAEASGKAVAAIHAGWRGLAAGVIERALQALLSLGADATMLRAVIGPHIGPCCYEVDTPVLDAMRKHFPNWRQAMTLCSTAHTDETMPVKNAQLNLGLLAEQELLCFGLAAEQIAQIPDSCTACDTARFYSYRRDGSGAGRLVHFIAAQTRLDTARDSA